jgi:hypothetical protein
MTSTDKPVTRVTLGSYPQRTGMTGRGFGKPRKLAITLGPGDLITIRWYGTQQKVSVPAEWMARRSFNLEARSMAAQKLNAKRRRKV